MQKENVIRPYVRQAHSPVVVKEKRKYLIKRRLMDMINAQNLFVFIAAFLMGRASIFGSVAPFGLIFWSVIHRNKREISMNAAIIISLGAFSSGAMFGMVSYWAGVLFVLFAERLQQIRGKKEIAPVILLPLAILFGNSLYYIANTPVPYEMIFAAVESLIAVPVAPLMFYGIPLIWQTKAKEDYSQEEIVGGLFFYIFIIVGLGGETVSLSFGQNLLATIPILVIAGIYGGALGAATGLIMGLVISVNSGTQDLIVAMAFSGLLAGLFKDYGKKGVVFGYFVGMYIIYYFFFGFADIYFRLTLDASAALCYYLLPEGFLARIRMFSPAFVVLNGNDEAEEKLRRKISLKINDLAAIFQEVSAGFSEAATWEEMREKKSRLELIEVFSYRTCKDCGSFNKCWVENYDTMYSSITKIMDENLGYDLSVKDLPSSLRKRCRYVARMVKGINNMQELYQLNATWQEKAQSARSLVPMQLSEVARLMRLFSHEVKLSLSVDEKINVSNNSSLFSLEIGVSQAPKKNETLCGDYFSFLSLDGNRQALILSDGMGHGEKAYNESKATVRLMEEMLEAGFDQEMIFNTINSILRLRWGEESFATMDLAMLDLRAGTIELAKSGAVPTFIKRGNLIKELSANTLPLGIVKDIKAETCRDRLADKDLIIMVTDGVSEVPARVGKNQAWLKQALAEVDHYHPQLVADYIIEGALKIQKGNPLDDLTVIVCKVERLKYKFKDLS